MSQWRVRARGALGLLGAWLIRALGATWRVRSEGHNPMLGSRDAPINVLKSCDYLPSQKPWECCAVGLLSLGSPVRVRQGAPTAASGRCPLDLTAPTPRAGEYKRKRIAGAGPAVLSCRRLL